MSSARFALAPAPAPALLRSLAVGSALLVGVALPGGAALADAGTTTTVVGRLVQAWPEVEAGKPEVDGPISWVQNANGDAVRIPTASVGGITTGSTVQVTVGPEVGGTAADPLHDVHRVDVVAQATPDPVLRDPAGLTNQVTVVRVAPDGAAHDAVTEQQLVDLVDGPVADFWSEQSNGAISIGVSTAVRDWVAPAAGCADPTALWNQVATSVGFRPGPGKHLLLYVSSADTKCSYALAEVGSSPATGGRLYVHDAAASVIAHELGHNFGLGHSSGEQCDTAVESGTCRTVAYRDYYDVMGISWSRLGSLNVVQAGRLGVLPAAQQQALTAQGRPTTVTLAPLSGRSGTRALRLTGADGVDYWLEYRTPTGRDAWLGTTDNRYHLQPGVLLHRAGGLPDTSLLLDGTPTAAAGWDGDLQEALPVGSAVPVSGGDFTVVVQSAGPDGAVLSVTPRRPAVAPAVAPVPAPAPARRASPSAAAVLPATGASSAAVPPPGSTAGFWAPPYQAPHPLPVTPALASAADSTTGRGVLVPVAGALLAGTALLGLGLARRLRARRA